MRAVGGRPRGATGGVYVAGGGRRRAWLAQKFAGLPVETPTDEAGDFWATQRGESPRALLIGGPLDYSAPMKLGEPYPILAQLAHAPLLDELGVVLALLLILVGLALHLYLPRHRLAAEAGIKDNKMTPAEARRQMRFYAVGAPPATLLGGALVIRVIYDLAR